MSDAAIVPAPHPLGELVDRLATLADDPALTDALRDLADDLRGEPGSTGLALQRLCRGFGLSAFERDLVLLAGLPEEHEALAYLARTLHPSGEPRLCFAGIATALDLDHRGRHHLRFALESGPLRRYQVVVGVEGAPLPERSLSLAPGLWSVLRGADHWPDEVTPAVVRPLPNRTPALAQLAGAIAGEPRLVVVSGASSRPPSELAAVVAGALETLDRPWVAFEAATIDGPSALLASCHAVARSAIPVVIGASKTPLLARHPEPVVVCVDSVVGLAMDDRPLVSIELGARQLGESVQMWSDLAPELNGGAPTLAGLLRVDQVRASRAVADARAAATVANSAVTVDEIVRQVRHRTDVTLPASVRLVEPAAHWDDLVLSDDRLELLGSVVDRVRGQVRVLHEWGFAAARGTAGARVLLAGPPGTGKTFAAEVIAANLGLDLLVVDLSALVSKWLGETEKNIAEVFAAAERCQAVLFFDEADAIFGRRTDSSDAQGRWANLETAYLLGRMDRFDGLVVLATNLRGNIDEAFVRRIDVIVEFEEPSADERRRLWHGHLPDSAPLSDDVDIDQLAELYPITGGLVRNAVLDAAFGAAAGHGQIDQHALISAIRRQYQKAGRSFPGMPRRTVGIQPGGN
ncbi:MAG: ATP-binding protein [Acidimicrobiia bacterium]|nr:ATP-binding protein [Acidimicrobiia bacterium]